MSAVRHACTLWQNQTTHCRHFNIPQEMAITHSFLTATLVGGRPPLRLKFALKVTQPFENRRHRQISVYNVSTVRYSDKVQLWRIRSLSLPRPFQRAIDGVSALPLSPPKGVSKKRFFWMKFKFNRMKSCTKFLWVKTSSSKVVV